MDICIQNVIIERKTPNKQPYFIFKTCHGMVMKVSCQSYAHPSK